ncbi:Mbov_0397 family ICE element conjugal transfer ATPase [Williamsoniiplasma lucivorax]|uniref:Transfer complex protein TrsE n=1 Tax=Williamsoniiplasma lucivorax TaxID=209274 RepID=A0A2S5RF89_9MOLU|nr:DUF87 domain-containing protein [Williamsoniiplasma lucivorax]PPE05958.1 transfer complex protein TrsE [Williamsoniiplasma lucivorax]
MENEEIEKKLTGVIPKPPQKSTIKWGILWTDIVMALGGLVVGILIALAIPSLGSLIIDIVVKFIIVLIILFLFLLPLMPSPVSGNSVRMYHLFWWSISFRRIDKKHYKFEDEIYTTRKFNAYKKVNWNSSIDAAKDFLILSNIKETDNLFMCGISFEGKNIFQEDLVSQELMVEAFWDIFVNSEFDIQIVKLSVMSNRDKNNKHISRLINVNDELFEQQKIDIKQYSSRRKVLEEYTKKYVYKATDNRKDFLEDRYHLVLYGEKEKELMTEINRITALLNQKGLSAKKMNYYENVNLIAGVYTPLADPISPSLIEQNKDDLGKFLAFKEITFKRNCFQANGEEKYFKTATINKYPMNVGLGWLTTLFRSTTSVVISVKEALVNENKFLSSNLMNLKSNQESINQTKVVDIKAMEYEHQVYSQIVADLATGREKLKEVSSMIILSGNTEDDLREQVLTMSAELQKSGMSLNELLNRQIEGLEHFSLKPHTPLKKHISRYIPAYSIALGYPFVSQQLNDKNGLYVGVNLIGDQIIYDQFAYPEGLTTSHNFIIVGQSGSGKSHTIKKLAIWNTVNRVDTHIFDIENEYSNLARNLGEQVVSVGTKDGVINPLQILATPNEEMSSSLVDDMQMHLTNLEAWFKLLYPDANDYEVGYLTKEVASLYMNNLAIKNALDHRLTLDTLKTKDFPIMTDLINLMQLELKTIAPDQKVMHQRWIYTLSQDFLDNGKYQLLLNNHSTLEIGNYTLTVYNIKAIFDTPNLKLRNALLHLLFAYVTNRFNTLRIKNDIEFAKLVKQFERDKHPYPEKEAFAMLPKQTLLIDEGHKFMNDSEVTLNFIHSAVKMFRKYYAGLTFITQDVKDFIKDGESSKKTQAILTNTPARLIMLCNSKGAEDVNTLFTQDGGLTQEEMKYILNAGQGRGVFMKNSNNRHCIQVELNKVEKDIIRGRDNA